MLIYLIHHKAINVIKKAVPYFLMVVFFFLKKKNS